MQNLDRDPLNNKSDEIFCVLKNKSLKFYADGPKMMQLAGVIDFDIVKCVILIEEKHYDSETSVPSINETDSPVKGTEKTE